MAGVQEAVARVLAAMAELQEAGGDAVARPVAARRRSDGAGVDGEDGEGATPTPTSLALVPFARSALVGRPSKAPRLDLAPPSSSAPAAGGVLATGEGALPGHAA